MRKALLKLLKASLLIGLIVTACRFEGWRNSRQFDGRAIQIGERCSLQRDFELSWCEDVIVAGQPILDEIHAYQSQRGRPPKTLQDVITKIWPPPEHPENSDRSWYYKVVDDHFYLGVHCLHGMGSSSYDAFFFSSRPIDAAQDFPNKSVARVGNWTYAIGASDFFRSL